MKSPHGHPTLKRLIVDDSLTKDALAISTVAVSTSADMVVQFIVSTSEAAVLPQLIARH